MTSPPSAAELVVLFNPAVSSVNLGDHVIADAATAALDPFLQGKHAVDVSTHIGLTWNYMRILRKAPWKFVLGSNLLRGRMNGLFRQWDITPRSAPLAKGAILMGVGWWQYGDEPNRYTSRLYQYVLRSDIKHSVRDSYTAAMLGRAGIDNVAVTGCPSLWPLTEEHLATVPVEQGNAIVTTVTDYACDYQRDHRMLETLSSRYSTVFLWPQGIGDLSYVHELGFSDRVQVLSPTLAAYDACLSQRGVDYLGTRLHAGIRALQAGRRAIVVEVDNRAREMAQTFGLPTIARDDEDAMRGWCEMSAPVELRMPWDLIASWRGQFG